MSDLSNAKEPVELTREQLYEQVWTTSISQLAIKFGISGNGLKKICNRLDIPYPSLGHWAKKAAGQSVPTTPLPRRNSKTPDKVTITPTPPPRPAPVIAPELVNEIEGIKAQLGPLAVQEKLYRPHRVIAGWLAEIDARRKEARQKGYGAMFGPGDLTAMHQRHFRILDTIFKAFDRQKIKVTREERQKLFIESEEERLEIQLREKQRMTSRRFSPEERHRAVPGDYTMRDNLEGTGRLAFIIKRYSLPNNLRTEWLESDAHPMEALVSDIVATIVTAFPLLATESEARRESARQWQLAEDERRERAQQQQLEEYRWRRFVEVAQQWRDIETARSFISAMKRHEATIDLNALVGGRSVQDWVAWAEHQLVARDPVERGQGAVFATIAAINNWSYRD